MSGGEEALDITVIPFEFDTAGGAQTAYEDLDRWQRRRQKDFSAYRVAGADGEARLVVVVVLTEADHVNAIVRRLRRSGGTFRDLPNAHKQMLVDRTIQAGAQGLDARNSYAIALPLQNMSQDPEQN